MRILVDSSVFISFFNETDVFYKETIKLINKLAKDRTVELILPILVFLEVVYVLQKQLKKFDEEKIMRIFIASRSVELTYNLAKEILPIMRNINLKTSDAIIVATAKLTDAILITWDQKLKKEAAKLVKTKTPQEFSQGEFP